MADQSPALSRQFFDVLRDVTAAVDVQFSAWPNSLAHYTSVANAINIITTKSIFLFNARTLNDNQELDHAVTLIDKTTKNLLTREIRSAVVGGFAFHQRKQGAVYVFCLAEPGGPRSKETHDRLAMWRAYGDDGNGVAVEIFSECIATAPIANTGSVTLGKVLYREKAKNRLIRAIVSAFKESCARHGMRESDGSFVLSSALWRIAPFLKHEAFEEEREWRAVVEVSPAPFIPGAPDGTKLIEFHDGRPYVKLALRGKPTTRIEALVTETRFFKGALVGPSPRQSVNVAKVASALLKAEPAAEYLSTEVSTIPYRGRA